MDSLVNIFFPTKKRILVKVQVMVNYFVTVEFSGMEHVPNIFISFDKYLFLKVINILI